MPCNDADLEREWHKYCSSAHAGLAVAELGSSLHLIQILLLKNNPLQKEQMLIPHVADSHLAAVYVCIKEANTLNGYFSCMF